MVHDDDGRVVARRDADGVQVRTAHTPGGRIASVQVGSDEPVPFEHDEAGDVTAVHRAGSTWRVAHDWRGGLVSLTGPEGTTLRIERDPNGRPVLVDRAGRIERYAYDARDRLAGWTRPGGATTTVVHDLLGRIAGVDGPGGQLRFDHDLDAGTTIATDPFGGRPGTRSTRMAGWCPSAGSIHRHGARARRRAARGRAPRRDRLGFGHDHAGRTTAVYGDGTAVARYRYHDGELAEVEEPVAGRRFEWDALGRLTAVVDGDRRSEVDIDGFGRLRRVGATELRWDLSAPVSELAAIDEQPVLSAGHLVLAVDGRVLPASVVGPAATGAQPWGEAPADDGVSADWASPAASPSPASSGSVTASSTRSPGSSSAPTPRPRCSAARPRPFRTATPTATRSTAPTPPGAADSRSPSRTSRTCATMPPRRGSSATSPRCSAPQR